MLVTMIMLSKKEQDTSHRWYMWHGLLAGNLILVSIILSCLACFLCLSDSEIGPWSIWFGTTLVCFSEGGASPLLMCNYCSRLGSKSGIIFSVYLIANTVLPEIAPSCGLTSSINLGPLVRACDSQSARGVCREISAISDLKSSLIF